MIAGRPFMLARSKPRGGRSRRGFTLVEVLIAVALMASVGTAFTYGLGSVTRAREQVDHRTEARSLAGDLMENTKSAGYLRAPSGGVASYHYSPLPAGFQVATLGRTGNVVGGMIYGIPWDTSANSPYTGSDPDDPSVQRVTIIIKYNQQELYRVTDLKVNR